MAVFGRLFEACLTKPLFCALNGKQTYLEIYHPLVKTCSNANIYIYIIYTHLNYLISNYIITHSKINMSFQQESSLPTTMFQVPCQFSGGNDSESSQHVKRMAACIHLAVNYCRFEDFPRRIPGLLKYQGNYVTIS